MKKIGLALIGVVALLTMAACDVQPKTVTLEGPDIAKVAGTDYKATATGVYPGVGTATFTWWADVNNDVEIQDSEILRRVTVVGDAEQQAVSNLTWRPAAALVNKKIVLTVGASFLDPGSDEYITKVDLKTVTVRR